MQHERTGTTLYVPNAGSPLRISIREGSGIVGTDVPGDDRVMIDYEGAIYGQSNIRTYEDRVWQAWGRHTENYPTVARAYVKREELIEVGFLDPERREIHVDRQDVVDEWCAVAVPS